MFPGGLAWAWTLGVTAVICLAASIALWLVNQNAIRSEARHLNELTNKEAAVLGASLINRANDLYFLEQEALSEIARSGSELKFEDRFAGTVLAFLRSRSAYDQIRLLDGQGLEIVRARRDPAAGPEADVYIEDVSRLQHRGSQHYFLETLQAAPHSAVYSPIEFHIENGGLELPKKPVIRLSCRIETPDRQTAGVLVLNVLGSSLAAQLASDQSDDREVFLVTPDGNWRITGNGRLEQAEVRLPGEAGASPPQDVLNREGSSHGVLDDSEKIAAWRRVPIDPAELVHLQHRMNIHDPGRIRWYIVREAPISVVQAKAASTRGTVLALSFFSFLLLAPATWACVRAVQRQRASVRSLRETKRLLEAMFHTSPTGIFLIRPVRAPAGSIEDFEFRLVNEEGCRIAQRPLSDLRGHRLLELFPGNRDAGFFDAYVRVCETGTPETIEQHYPHEDLHRHYRVAALRLDEELLFNVVDITDEKAAQAVLVDARDAAQAASQAKSEFLAVMSHEIRTPMAGVLGFTELLGQTPLSSDQRDYVEVITESAENLLRIIDDILDFSRIEAGKIQFEAVRFSPKHVAEGVCALLQGRASDKGLTLACRVVPGIPDHVVGDAGRIRQVLVNLVGNAIKFTERGSVILSLARGETNGSDAELRIVFCVEDTGVGISEERLERVFDAFTQEDSSITRRYGGSGLGLSISRRLVELMGGKLLVRSRKGQGTRFEFDLALRQPQDSRDHASPPDDDHTVYGQKYPLKILAVDDDAVNRKLVRAMLRKMGYDPSLARGGAEALEMFKRSSPDFVFMDLQMPEMDGIDVTKAIRRIEEEEHRSSAYIAALTANVVKAELDRCLSSGMDECLTKPIRRDALLEALRRGFDHASRRKN